MQEQWTLTSPIPISYPFTPSPLLSSCRTLPKTLSYLQSKRPDLMPKPGFMRQLQALDASLQRVTRAAAKSAGGESSLRRYSEWDPTLLGE